ncbi:MAG TPA: hypothetical protein PKJ41_11025 [Bryobacteraceae bacterium]|nr:hypothetical protein [Bryobacteraceae bacterium]HPT27598.1 hypothetical protein [Bryobacteraceae bacterium]
MNTAQTRLVWTVAVAAVLAVGFFPAQAVAQEPTGAPEAAGAQDAAQQGQNLERLAPGFGIRAITLSGGLFSLDRPVSTSVLGQSGTARYMGVGGAGVELGWRPASRTNLADVRYRMDQSWNSVYEDLNGMDHVFTLITTSGLGTRWRRSFSLNAESRLYSSLLFSTPVVATEASAAAGGPSEIGTSLGDSSLGLNSPLLASYFGSRRNAAGAGFNVSFAKSPRTSWFTAVNVNHQRAASSSSEGVSRDLLYPAVTMGTVTGGVAYAYSRDTTLGFDVEGARSESNAFRTMSGAASGSVTHRLKNGFSVFGRGGYSLIDRLDIPGRPSRGVQASAGLTGTRGVHSVRLMGYQDRMDHFGLGNERSIGADAVWNVTGRSSPWSSSLSVGYIRINGFYASKVEGVVARGLISRRLARNVSLGFDVAYSTVAGRIPSLLPDLTQGGARMFLTYTPQP